MTNQDGSSKARSTHTHPHHLEQSASEDTLMMDAHSTALGKTYEEFWWSPFSRRTQGWWLWEISGTVLSIACMVAILIILPYLDNSPLNDWRFSVAPSTMISTFITVAKTSMLLAVAAGISQLKWQHFHEETRPLYELNIYDEATRGPWGALAFIFRMRLRTGTLLASLGAFVILFSLTMEPFAQQILSMQTRYIPKAGEKPWISKANSYDHSHSEFGKRTKQTPHLISRANPWCSQWQHRFPECDCHSPRQLSPFLLVYLFHGKLLVAGLQHPRHLQHMSERHFRMQEEADHIEKPRSCEERERNARGSQSVHHARWHCPQHFGAI